MSEVRIEQIDPNQFGSNWLLLVSEMSPVPGVIERKNVEGEKGELITAIVISLATSTAYDLLKAGLLRLVNHPGRSQGARLRVDGKAVSSDDLSHNQHCDTGTTPEHANLPHETDGKE